MSRKAFNKSISLCGNWEFSFTEDGSFEEADIVSGVNRMKWYKCDVPGNAQLDLFKNGIVSDPFFGLNAEAVREYEHFEWWYRKKFKLREEFIGKRLELLFHGLDTFASIWINGEFLGNTDNMFIPHGFDVSSHIKEDEENELLVKFASPLFASKGKELSGCYTSTGTFESLWARKARHTYGWDIAPRLLTSGIWREVELIEHDRFEIKDVFCRVAELTGKYAKVVFHVDLELPKCSRKGLKLTVHGNCGEKTFDTECLVGSARVEVTIDLPDAELWWPFGYGSPNLYDIKITLFRNEVLLHEVFEKIGIRKVFVDQEKDSFGNRNFIIKVNDTPIFCKGTNSVPMDAFHSRDIERIPRFINMVREINCNLVRVWGGGVYEHELFYDLCDEYGILVMQDFMFACAIYPQEEEFLKVASKEAVVVVKMLRNHPSIIVWYGDNEIDLAYHEWYNQTQSPENNKLTREILKDICRNFDGTRPYMPSSPFSPTSGVNPNSQFEGDSHFYRHGTYYKDEEYLNDRSRFYSEIGHLSLDNEESIRKFIPEDKIWPIDREVWDYHAGSLKVPYYHPNRLGCILKSVENMFGNLPNNLKDLVLSSQVVQAEALKFWIEQCRLRKFECSGIIWWNLIDCWPQFSDAIVDYYYGKKLAYYYIKKAQEPICIVLSEPQGELLNIVACNESGDSVGGNVRVYDIETDETYYKGSFQVCKNSNIKLGEIRLLKAEHKLLLIEWDIKGNKYFNHYLAGSPLFDFDTYKSWLDEMKIRGILLISE